MINSDLILIADHESQRIYLCIIFNVSFISKILNLLISKLIINFNRFYQCFYFFAKYYIIINHINVLQLINITLLNTTYWNSGSSLNVSLPHNTYFKANLNLWRVIWFLIFIKTSGNSISFNVSISPKISKLVSKLHISFIFLLKHKLEKHKNLT